MPAALPADLKQQAWKLYIIGLSPAQIGQRLNLKGDSVHNWATENNWFAQRNVLTEALALRLSKPANDHVARQSKTARRLLAREAVAQARVLAKERPQATDLGSTKDGEGRASVANRVADLCAKVFAWDADKPSALGALEDIRRRVESNVIDVEEIKPELPQ